MINNEVLRKFVCNEIVDEAQVVSTIEDIIRVVVSRYFSKHMYDQEVFSLAYTKSVQLLNAPHCRSTANIVNFLFSGIRNEIGNYYKRHEREVSVDEVLPMFSASIDRVPWPMMDFRNRCLALALRFAKLGYVEYKREFESFFESYDYETLSETARIIVRVVCSRMIMKGAFNDKRWGSLTPNSERGD